MSFHSPPERYTDTLSNEEYAVWVHGLNSRIHIERFEKDAMKAIEGKAVGDPIQMTMIMNKVYVIDITDTIKSVFPHMTVTWQSDEDDFWYTVTIRWLKV
jgi:hypothetical protein